jgi:hypothetical protein
MNPQSRPLTSREAGAWRLCLSHPPLTVMEKTKCMQIPVKRRQKTAPGGAVFGVVSTAPQHVSLAALNHFHALCAKPSTRRLFLDSPPSLPTFYKGPILAPRPLSPKWTSLDFLRVMPGNTYGTLSPALHRPRFLTRPPLTLTFTSFTT